MADQLQLYSYWRSSAAYRVRIGLNLKGLAYETLPVHLVRDGGEQHAEEYRVLNPQELVPVLKHGDRVLRQSVAILEYLDETWPEPALLPVTSRDRGSSDPRNHSDGVRQWVATYVAPTNACDAASGRALQFGWGASGCFSGRAVSKARSARQARSIRSIVGYGVMSTPKRRAL